MGRFSTLSLDLGSTFGWCKGTNGVIAESGEVALLAGGGKDAHPGHRWMMFQNWLIKNGDDVIEVFFENVTGFRSGQAAVVYGALKSQLEIFCLVHGIRMCSMKPQQVKIDFAGKGNADKAAMCEVAINLGWKNGKRGSQDFHNECDAIALYWCIWKRRLIEPRFAHDALQQSSLVI